MRSRYGYRIICDNKQFRFALIPGNKGLQSIGESKKYDTYENCVKALKDFRNFVIENKINDVKSPCINIAEQVNGKSVQYICDGVVIFETRTYTGGSIMKGCKTGIASVYKNIDAYVNNQK